MRPLLSLLCLFSARALLWRDFGLATKARFFVSSAAATTATRQWCVEPLNCGASGLKQKMPPFGPPKPQQTIYKVHKGSYAHSTASCSSYCNASRCRYKSWSKRHRDRAAENLQQGRYTSGFAARRVATQAVKSAWDRFLPSDLGGRHSLARGSECAFGGVEGRGVLCHKYKGMTLLMLVLASISTIPGN